MAAGKKTADPDQKALQKHFRAARTHITASRRDAAAHRRGIAAISRKLGHKTTGIGAVNKKLGGANRKLTGLGRRLGSIKTELGRTNRGLNRLNTTLASSTATIDAAIANLHKSAAHDAALTQAEIKNVLGALGTTNSTLNDLCTKIGNIDGNLLTMAADMAALRAHYMTHGASGLSPSDLNELKDLIRQGNQQQSDRWADDDHLSSIQTRLSENAEKTADKKADYEWWRQAVGNRKQTFASNGQNARQQHSLAGLLVTLEFGLINAFVTEPVRIGVWLKHRSAKKSLAREKSAIKRGIAMARTRTRATAPAPAP